MEYLAVANFFAWCTPTGCAARPRSFVLVRIQFRWRRSSPLRSKIKSTPTPKHRRHFAARRASWCRGLTDIHRHPRQMAVVCGRLPRPWLLGEGRWGAPWLTAVPMGDRRKPENQRSSISSEHNYMPSSPTSLS